MRNIFTSFIVNKLTSQNRVSICYGVAIKKVMIEKQIMLIANKFCGYKIF